MINSQSAYVNMGANGIQYRTSLNIDTRKISGRRNEGNLRDPNIIFSPLIDTVKLVDTSRNELLKEINARIATPLHIFPRLSLVIALTSFVLVIAHFSPRTVAFFGYFSTAQALFGVALLVFILGIFYVYAIYKRGQAKRITYLKYKLSEGYKQEFKAFYQAVSLFANSAYIWNVINRTQTWDWKRNAGASALISRRPLNLEVLAPPFIQTNFNVYCLKMPHLRLFFFPDQILIFQKGGYSAIEYEDSQLDWGTTTFIESEKVPNDSRLLHYTWQYVRKDGNADLRFANNRQIPVLEYGQFIFQSPMGLSFQLMTSSYAKMEQFAKSLESHKKFIYKKSQSGDTSSNTQYQTKHETHTRQERDDDPYKILQISNDALWGEISIAYRKLAQKYHPDKVANLAPEFQELANIRMKQINAAYEELKRKFN
ncbi:MAG: J domain-containing protein [Chloroflexota bacterium]